MLHHGSGSFSDGAIHGDIAVFAAEAGRIAKAGRIYVSSAVSVAVRDVKAVELKPVDVTAAVAFRAPGLLRPGLARRCRRSRRRTGRPCLLRPQPGPARRRLPPVFLLWGAKTSRERLPIEAPALPDPWTGWTRPFIDRRDQRAFCAISRQCGGGKAFRAGGCG